MSSNAQHNPDVLTCLANLSADEVFTPPKLVSSVLDLLPKSLFDSPETTFIDPFCKSGVFLREIARRLNDGLKNQFPDDQKRIDHILTKQVFGFAITELTALLSRRSLYCSKKADGKYSIATAFKNADGNIRLPKTSHTWTRDGRCDFCGANQNEYERDQSLEEYAYPFIHGADPRKVFNMKFDVIVGNPPYQLSDGGGTGSSARPLYHLFIQQAMKLEPRYLSMIVPSRWFSGGKGLDEFRNEMLADVRIAKLVDFSDSRDVFPGVDIAGGVCYFLWDRDSKGLCEITNVTGGDVNVSRRALNEMNVLIRHNTTLGIVRKSVKLANQNISTIVSARKPFGIDSKARPKSSGDITIVTSAGTGPYKRSEVNSGLDLIDSWKVFVSKASSDHGGQADKNGKRKVFARVIAAPPGHVCSESYLVVGPFKSERMAKNCVRYLTLRTIRYLVAATLFTQNITRERFEFVPLLDMQKSWSDEDLFTSMALTSEEIDHIEQTMRIWESD